jgi:hypothetical protein
MQASKTFRLTLNSKMAIFQHSLLNGPTLKLTKLASGLWVLNFYCKKCWILSIITDYRLPAAGCHFNCLSAILLHTGRTNWIQFLWLFPCPDQGLRVIWSLQIRFSVLQGRTGGPSIKNIRWPGTAGIKDSFASGKLHTLLC